MNVLWSFWNININFLCVNIGQKMYWEIFVLWCLYIKNRRFSTDKMWTGGTFCRVYVCECVCLDFHILYLCTWAYVMINASFCVSYAVVILVSVMPLCSHFKIVDVLYVCRKHRVHSMKASFVRDHSTSELRCIAYIVISTQE